MARETAGRWYSAMDFLDRTSTIDSSMPKASQRELGIRILAVDRPGTGLSAAQPGRTLKSFAEDIEELLDELGLESAGVLGLSGGGPYALALGRYLATRIGRLTVVSGMGPADAPGAQSGVSWTIPGKPGLVRRLILWLTRLGLDRDPQKVLEQSKETMASVDGEALNDPECAETFMEVIRAGFIGGSACALDDASILSRPWCFALEEVAHPVSLWHGEQDLNVLASVARYVHQSLPSSTLELVEGEGHLTLGMNHVEQILSELIA